MAGTASLLSAPGPGPYTDVTNPHPSSVQVVPRAVWPQRRIGAAFALSEQSCHSWQGNIGWSWPYLQRLFWFFFSIWRAMLGSNIYLNIRANTQHFVKTQYEYWILKNFKCTMKLEKFSCMLREVARMEGKVITRSDRNYKSWKIVVWPTNILPLMSIKFYSAGGAWKLRSKCVSCNPALMASTWWGKKILQERWWKA